MPGPETTRYLMLRLPNFYNELYIVCYPPGAGGNFLINCLSLSDDSVLSDSILANDQLQGRLDQNAKISYLKTQLDLAEQTKNWNDLNLGNKQFFGINSHDVVDTFTEIISYKINSIVGDCIDAGKRIFFICHNILHLLSLLKIWPNSKVIFFTNYQNFLQRRPGYNQPRHHKMLNRYWLTVKDPSWPQDPPRNLDEFSELSQSIQDELIDLHKFYIAQWFEFESCHDRLWNDQVIQMCQKNPKNSFTWNVTNSYTNVENLINSLHEISNKFKFQLIDTKIIEWYFHRWKTVILQCQPPR